MRARTAGPAPEPGDLLTLRIDSLGAGGVGVGRDEQGRVVFVPRSAPGDLVRALPLEQRKRWARARLVELLEPGPQRRPPPCPLYDRCGGCAMQHLDEGKQRAAKRQIVEDALRRIGGIDMPVPTIRSDCTGTGYRNRITLVLRRDGSGVLAGYRALWSPNEIVDVEDCLLGEPAVRRALGQLRAAWGSAAEHLPEGDELRVTIRAAGTGEVALHIEGGTPGRAGDPSRIRNAVENLVSYVGTDSAGTRETLAGADVFADTWQGTEFRLGPGTFLQVNRAESDAMDAFLDACVGPRHGLRVADLYAGVAARALRWTREGAQVTAVESDPGAAWSAADAARREKLDVEIVAGAVEDAARSFSDVDVAIVNPPRAGLSRRVSESLVAAGPGRGLGYVSCDPATLARDLERLGGAWAPVSVRAFDAFPQTAHVETIVWLERPGDGARSEPEGA